VQPSVSLCSQKQTSWCPAAGRVVRGYSRANSTPLPMLLLLENTRPRRDGRRRLEQLEWCHAFVTMNGPVKDRLSRACLVVLGKYDYIIVRTKSQPAGLICRIYQYYTASDCQTTTGHNSRRSAWGKDRWLWRERLWEKGSFSAERDKYG